MIFLPTRVDGALLLELERLEDERGFFSRIWCTDEVRRHGLDPSVVQCNLSYTARRGTLRGMHYQAGAQGESKTVRCVRGAVFDVVADLRPDSPTYRSWAGVELTQENRLALHVPKGCAHGFQALTDEVELIYFMSHPFVPEAARGFRWNDPAFAIRWPIPDPRVSERDAAFPDFLP